MALPCVKGAIAGPGADLFGSRDLVQQVRQTGAVALVARGELCCTEVAGGRLHNQYEQDQHLIRGTVFPTIVQDRLSSGGQSHIV